MARIQKPTTATVEALRPYLDGVARKLADDLWGPAGPAWGTTLTELEEVLLETRDLLTRQVLQLGLQRQATAPVDQRPTAYRHCPTCRGAVAAAAAEPPPRQVDTRAGAAHWQEPQAYCP